MAHTLGKRGTMLPIAAIIMVHHVGFSAAIVVLVYFEVRDENGISVSQQVYITPQYSCAPVAEIGTQA